MALQPHAWSKNSVKNTRDRAMAVYRLPASTDAHIQGIYKLNTTTLEDAYMQKHFPDEPITFVEKVKKAWASYWLNTCLGCWFAGNLPGKGGFDQDRVSIVKYQSTLNALITHLSKTTLNPDWADFLDMPAESLATDNLHNEELPAKVKAFYEALKERVELIAGNDKMRPETIASQADFIRAGLQEVANMIQQHNEANASGLFKRPQVPQWWNLIVDKLIIEKEYANLYTEISPDELLGTGEFADDYVKHKIAVYHRTFEENPSFASIKEQEDIEELTANVKQDVQKARASEFQEKIDLLTSEDYIQARIGKRASYLKEHTGSDLPAFNAQIAALKEEIPEDTIVSLISTYLYHSTRLDLLQEQEKGVDVVVNAEIQAEIDILQEFIVEPEEETTPVETDSDDDSPLVGGVSDPWDFENPASS
jgi:hypothetical protein